MEEWKRRLIDLGQEEMRREQAMAESIERAEGFIKSIAAQALGQVADGCRLVGRVPGRLNAASSNMMQLPVYRNDRSELTFEVEAVRDNTVVLRVWNDRNHGERLLHQEELLVDGETVADLSIDRVRDAAIEQLERRLSGEI